MDALLRGSIERRFDSILDEKVLDSALAMFKVRYSPAVKNLEDTLFGYVIGRTVEFAFSAITIFDGRTPTDAELVEIAQLLERRALEVKSKITLVTNK